MRELYVTAWEQQCLTVAGMQGMKAAGTAAGTHQMAHTEAPRAAAAFQPRLSIEAPPSSSCRPYVPAATYAAVPAAQEAGRAQVVPSGALGRGQ